MWERLDRFPTGCVKLYTRQYKQQTLQHFPQYIQPKFMKEIRKFSVFFTLTSLRFYFNTTWNVKGWFKEKSGGVTNRGEAGPVGCSAAHLIPTHSCFKDNMSPVWLVWRMGKELSFSSGLAFLVLPHRPPAAWRKHGNVRLTSCRLNQFDSGHQY